LYFYPITPELVALRKEKDEAEKRKREEVFANISPSTDTALSDMRELNLPEETIAKVQVKLEQEARKSVQEVQGQYYETCD